MNYSQIKTEITTDSTSQGYATPLASQAWNILAAMMNKPVISAPRPGTWFTELGIMAVLGPTAGDAFLTTLESVAASSTVLSRIVRIVHQSSGIGNPTSGIDLGTAEVQAMLQGLAQQINSAPFTIAVNALIAAGTRLYSRVEVVTGISGDFVTSDQIQIAMSS